MPVAKKLRRIAVVYLSWDRNWKDMKGRRLPGPMTRTTDGGATQIVHFTSKAPRVFPDKESLSQFLEGLAREAGTDKFTWSSGSLIHGFNLRSTPTEIAEQFLDLPESQRTRLHLQAQSAEQQIGPGAGLHAAPGHDADGTPLPYMPGNCSVTLSVPEDWANGRDDVPGLGATHSVEIRVVNEFEVNGLPTKEVSTDVIEGLLRGFTISPTKTELRKLKQTFPLAVPETRQTSTQRKWEARIQRKAAVVGLISAVVVTVGSEVVKGVIGVK